MVPIRRLLGSKSCHNTHIFGIFWKFEENPRKTPKMTTFERFPSFSVMDDAAMAPSGHFRQDSLTESCVCVSYESQWRPYVDCRGISRATTHIFSEIFVKLVKIRPKPSKTVKIPTLLRFPSFSVMEWHGRRCCDTTRPLQTRRSDRK